MTEPEWLVCEDPTPMLRLLGDRPGERKLRLFAVACCRLAERFLIPERINRLAVEGGLVNHPGVFDVAAIRAVIDTVECNSDQAPAGYVFQGNKTAERFTYAIDGI
jgi:hypothetical protein